ncbi:MAG: xylose isomerase, partial [Pseudomonadota bacterium]
DPLNERYAGWEQQGAKAMLDGARSLDQIAAWVESSEVNPSPVSGRQEMLENIVNRYV